MDLAQLLFSFEGRIGRGPFWLGTVFVWVCYGLAFTAFNGLVVSASGFFTRSLLTVRRICFWNRPHSPSCCSWSR